MSLKSLGISTIIALCLSVSVHAKENKNVEFLNSADRSTEVPFSEAVRVGNQLFLSGQVGISPKTKKIVKGGLSNEAEQTLKNIKQTLERYDYKMTDVVKCTVILTDISNFSEFNKIYKKAFTFPYPARTTFAASSLPGIAQIEIECIAAK